MYAQLRFLAEFEVRQNRERIRREQNQRENVVRRGRFEGDERDLDQLRPRASVQDPLEIRLDDVPVEPTVLLPSCDGRLGGSDPHQKVEHRFSLDVGDLFGVLDAEVEGVEEPQKVPELPRNQLAVSLQVEQIVLLVSVDQKRVLVRLEVDFLEELQELDRQSVQHFRDIEDRFFPPGEEAEDSFEAFENQIRVSILDSDLADQTLHQRVQVFERVGEELEDLCKSPENEAFRVAFAGRDPHDELVDQFREAGDVRLLFVREVEDLLESE